MTIPAFLKFMRSFMPTHCLQLWIKTMIPLLASLLVLWFPYVTHGSSMLHSLQPCVFPLIPSLSQPHCSPFHLLMLELCVLVLVFLNFCSLIRQTRTWEFSCVNSPHCVQYVLSSVTRRLCVFSFTCCILSTKIHILLVKWGHFWEVKLFWIVLIISKDCLMVTT